MSENKPAYEQLEQELNEYKELLWQLSDEYKVNLGAAEKELAEIKEKYKQLESSKEVVKVEENTGSNFTIYFAVRFACLCA